MSPAPRPHPARRPQDVVHPLAGLVAAGLQDTVEAGREEVPRELLLMLENKFSLLSSTEAEIAGRDIFKVLIVVRRYLPDFDTQPVKEAVFRAARRIAVRDGRLGGPRDEERRSYKATCGSRDEVRAAPKVPAPFVASSNTASRPRIEERLADVDDERKAKLAALADSMLAMCAARPEKKKARARRDSKVA